MEKQIKCEHCHKWTELSQQKCEFCNCILNEKYLKEKEELSKAKGMTLPLIEIGKDENFIVKGFKGIFRVGQLIFFAIISLIAALSASTVH